MCRSRSRPLDAPTERDGDARSPTRAATSRLPRSRRAKIGALVDGDGEHDLAQPAVQPGDDADREQDARDGQQDVDDAHEDRVDPPPTPPASAPIDAADGQRP